MHFSKPVVVYTSENNVEAHMIVEMLVANGIEALADEDQSGVSMWAMGTIGQFHRPQVWIDTPDSAKAIALVKQFEAKRNERMYPTAGADAIDGTVDGICDECETTTAFSAAVDGTIQDCPKCGAYVDVGLVEPDVSTESFGLVRGQTKPDE